MLIGFKRSPMMHPAVHILLWVCLVISIQSLQATGLLLAGFPLLAVAYAVSATRLITLLRRTRWIMLSLLLIYAYATPGVAVWASLAQFSPTNEGLTDGLMQLCRLAFTLAGLAILLNLLPRQQLISGLYVLTYPLRYVGLSRERLAVRLALTLEYAESVIWDPTDNWRTNIRQMLAPAEVKTHSIELHTTPYITRDGIILAIGCSLLVLVLL
jgi:energy-coupling factor transporter transmembrane protein EcfT